MASSVSDENGELGFQIAPMIDVVFVLMLFFMATFGMRELHLPAQIPSPGVPQPTAPVAVKIDVASDGRVLVNEQLLGLPGDKKLGDLRSWLSARTSALVGGIPLLSTRRPMSGRSESWMSSTPVWRRVFRM